MVSLIIPLVFVAVFTVVVLLLTAFGSGASAAAKKTLHLFDTALKTSRADDLGEIIDIRRREALSGIPWLNRVLLQLDVVPQLRRLLSQANLDWTIGRLMLLCAASGAGVGLLFYLRTEAWVLSLALAVAAAHVPYGYVRWKRAQRFAQFEQKLPDALDLLVSTLRAGHSLVSGFGIVSRDAAPPVDREFRICFDEQNFGLDFRAALENLSNRVPLQDVRMMTAAILIQKESGGNLAELLERVAHIIRERFRLQRQIRVHTAQGRLTGWILSALPLTLGLLLYLVNPEYISTLWTRPIGVKLLYAAVIMTCVGGLIIRSIVRVRI